MLDKYTFEFIRKLNNLAYTKKFRFETFLGRVQVLHDLHAEDVRRQAVPGALRGPRRDGRPAPGPRRREARPADGGRDHRGPLPAGDAHLPERRQGAARRAGLLLPAAHRRQHGVDRPLHQLRAAAVQARRRRGVRADEHPRVGCADQADREPVLRRHPRDEAPRRQLLLRQPAGCASGCRRRVPATRTTRTSYRFLDTKRENADEKIRIKTLSLGVVIPDITFELAKNGRGHVPVLPVRRRARLRHAVLRRLGHREVLRDGGRSADQEDQDQGARVLPDPRRDPVRVRLPVHHVRGHGEPGQPDRRQDHHVQPVLRDPPGIPAHHVQR